MIARVALLGPCGQKSDASPRTAPTDDFCVGRGSKYHRYFFTLPPGTRRPVRHAARSAVCRSVLALLLTACGGTKKSNAQEPDRRDVLLEQQAARIEDLRDRLQAADTERRGLFGALTLAEQRLGLRPFNPRTIRRIDGVMRFEPGKCTVLRRPGDRGRKVDLERVASRFPAYVVAYWATWCKPCTTPEEIAALQRLKDDLEQMGSTLFGVAIDGLKKVRNHRRADEWHYPIWHRDDAHIEWLPKAFIDRVGLGLPLFLVVSRDGRLLYWRTKPLDADAHEELLTAAVRPH